MFLLKNVKYRDILFIRELRISKNKVTCIVGESGSGKTTLTKLLNLLISADSGEIYFQGKDINTYDPIQLRSKVLMVSQNPVIYDGSVRDNLLKGFFFSEAKIPSDERLKKMLKMVQLDKSLDEDSENLSGGEKQRLSLGRALLMNPEVFIFDEPTSALDEETEDKVMETIIAQLKERRKTVIIITHSKKIAHRYGEMIIEVKDGEIHSVEEKTK